MHEIKKYVINDGAVTDSKYYSDVTYKKKCRSRAKIFTHLGTKTVYSNRAVK